MEYSEALNYINNLKKFASKNGIENIKALLNRLNNPQDSLRFIHIAGTNGKGSIAAFTHSVLVEAGYKVGLFTSPYLEKFVERIRVNDWCISEDDVVRLIEMIKREVEKIVADGGNYPTVFEFMTAMAFVYFFEQKCDVVVLEVGLGGRFDSTNVISRSILSVIATISRDHMEYLGETIEEIAAEKAGIIKPNGNVLLYPQSSKEAENVIMQDAAKKEAQIFKPEFKEIDILESRLERQVFSYKGHKNIEIQLSGVHQIKNAVMAIEISAVLNESGFHISQKVLDNGLRNARWPGRFEVLRRNPYFIIDAAHNDEGAKILISNLERYFKDKKVIFIFGVLKDKEYMNMIKIVAPKAKKFITVTPDNPRAVPAEELAQLLSSYCKDIVISDTIKKAVNICMDSANKDDIICAFGSLYYIGEVRKILLDARS